MDFSVAVKLAVYEAVASSSRIPGAAEVAQQLDTPTSRVESAFRTLADQRLLVLEPGTVDQIRMAPPFSGVATPFVVRTAGQSYYANCVWDALGVPAALGEAGEVRTRCAQSGVPLILQIGSAGPKPVDCTVHFAVPAALWWEDIIFT